MSFHHSKVPGIKTLTGVVDIFPHLQKWPGRVWGGKSTRDKTFLSLLPLLGPNTLACSSCPFDPLSGEMRRLCHNSAAPTSYHPFHKHLRTSQSFIIDAWRGQSKATQGAIKMRAWVGQGHVQLPHPRCELEPGQAAPRATPLCRDRGCLGWAWPSLSLGLDLLPIILLCTMQSNTTWSGTTLKTLR